MLVKNTIKQGLIIAALAIAAAVVTYFYHPKAPTLYEVSVPVENELSVEEARKLDGEIIWIDARTDKDFQEGHIEGALLLNQEGWADLLWKHRDVIERTEGSPVIVYCGGKRCKRSNEIAQRLRTEMGMSPVYVLKGDWREW